MLPFPGDEGSSFEINELIWEEQRRAGKNKLGQRIAKESGTIDVGFGRYMLMLLRVRA
jgi:hypothetical protein